MMKKTQINYCCTFLLSILIFLYFTSCDNKEVKSGESGDYKIDGKIAEIFVTAKNTNHRLFKLEDKEFSVLNQPDERISTIIIDPFKKQQKFIGIGGALTDAAAETFYKLPEEKQNEIMTTYFNRESGIGYTLCRVNIHSCDFSSSSYTYNDVENDTLLENFNIDHDREFKLPFIKEAINASNKNLKIFASPWSPPAWMKTNNDMLHGGKLKSEFQQTWADYFVKFIDEYNNEGVPVWGITVQNEPLAVQIWESCIYTAEEEKDFVKNFLGPTLKKSKYNNTNIIIWDHNRGLMYQRAKTVYDDPEASKYVWGTGYHWYVGDHFNNVRLHAEAFPDKNLLFTEGCVGPFNYDSLHLWKWGEIYGESILQDLNNGAVGWTDWNILLDETGGPNHVNNFCYAPIIGDTRSGELIYMTSYYYLGHFSKFILPGAYRIICSSNNDDLLATAFINPDNTIAVVVLNLTDKSITFKIWIENRACEAVSPGHSIMSIVIK